MKNVKQLLVIMLAAIMVFTVSTILAACGDTPEDDTRQWYYGTYVGDYAQFNGARDEIVDVFGSPLRMTIEKKNVAIFEYNGETYTTHYSMDGNNFKAEGGGVELTGTIQEATMTLTNVLDSGIDIIFHNSNIDSAGEQSLIVAADAVEEDAPVSGQKLLDRPDNDEG